MHIDPRFKLFKNLKKLVMFRQIFDAQCMYKQIYLLSRNVKSSRILYVTTPVCLIYVVFSHNPFHRICVEATTCIPWRMRRTAWVFNYASTSHMGSIFR